MALPPNSEFRGVAAAIPQPTSGEDALRQLYLYMSNLWRYNDGQPRILFRNAYDDEDIREAVYRWDTRSYQEIFHTGFTPRPQSSTQFVEDYYNLELFVNGGGIPGYTSPDDQIRSVFVSTTRSTSWRPRVTTNCTLYRYEIFAPGGIDAVLTLGNRNHYPNQQEISFVGGINPQYIRTALPYEVEVVFGSQFPTYTTQWDGLIRNGSFNPNPTSDGWTTGEFLNRLRNPTCPRSKECLMKYTNMPRHDVEKRDVEDTPPPDEEYKVDPVCRVRHYIECAFNLSDKEEAYLFFADQCLLINYAPGTTDDKIIRGPLCIGDEFPYLKDTIFASGIDAAFTASSKNVAYIFRSNIYALINFAADGGCIIEGPKRIIDGFPYLKNWYFENGIDAAFASSRENEAYIFKGDQYVLISFAPGTTEDHRIQGPKKITESFPSLEGTIFQNGLDAAFSSSKENEAYIFKDDNYALINYAPGTTDDKIINGPITPISDGFHSLNDIIPMSPCGC